MRISSLPLLSLFSKYIRVSVSIIIILWIIYLQTSKPWENIIIVKNSVHITPFPADRYNMSNVLVYIVYHDKTSQKIAEAFSQSYSSWTKPVFVRSTVFFESMFFRDILPFEYENWKYKQYVGMLSYKAVDIRINNMTFFGEDIPWILSMSLQLSNESASSRNDVNGLHAGYDTNMSYHEHDIIPFLQGQDYQLLKQATEGHGKAYQIAWDSLLLSTGYSISQIRSADNYHPFFRNSFLGKPSWMKVYCQFISEAIDHVISNDTLNSLFTVDASYNAAKLSVANHIFRKDYYELFPFVFERLPVFYFNIHGAKIFEYSNLRPGNHRKRKSKNNYFNKWSFYSSKSKSKSK